jgi:4-amino-4-deoxy-L-arabinose transferase-like glycosyltransferase
MLPKKRSFYFMCCLFLVLANIGAQVVLQRKGLDNLTVNRYSPTSSDAHYYVEEAQVLANGGNFAETFEGGFRLPGYPVFLSLFYRLSSAPLLLARYAQILLGAMIVLLSYLTLQNITKSDRKSLIGTVVISVWLPLYYFAPLILPETLSIFLVSLSILILSSLDRERKPAPTLYLLPVLLAALIYLKPNHILFIVPLVAYLALVLNKPRTKYLAALAAILLISILPWTIFLSSKNGQFIPLSTTAGVNLYLGTGVDTDDDTSAESNSISKKAAVKLNLRDPQLSERVKLETQGMSYAAQNSYYTGLAKKIWMGNPASTTLYGFSKILHGFGFSVRGPRDLILVFVFLASLASSVYLWRSRKYRPWCVYYWATLAVMSLQMFAFLANQRFKTILVDIPALMMILLACFSSPWALKNEADAPNVEVEQEPSVEGVQNGTVEPSSAS